MGNSTSSIQKQVEDIEGAVEGLNRVMKSMRSFKDEQYKAEFREKFIDSLDENVEVYSSQVVLSYGNKLALENIKQTVENIVSKPSGYLASYASDIINVGVELGNQIIGGKETNAFSSFRTANLVTKDNKLYKVVMLCASGSIKTEKWFIKEGIACTAYLYAILKINSKQEYTPQHNPRSIKPKEMNLKDYSPDNNIEFDPK